MEGGTDPGTGISRGRRTGFHRRIGDVTRWLSARQEHAGLVVAVGIAIWLISPIRHGGPPVGDDVVAHLVRAQYGLEHFARDWRVDGWQPSFGLGYQEFLFLGPLFTWLVGLGQVLSLGQLSLLGAFKLTIVVAFVALPVSVAFLARSFGLSRTAAGVAAVLSLALSSPFGGVGLEGVFTTGLLAHELGAVLFCLSLGSAIRLIAAPGGGWIVATGVTTALLSITHNISLILLGAFVAVVLLLVFLHVGFSAALRPRSGHPSGEEAESGPTDGGPVGTTALPVDRAHVSRMVRSLAAAYLLAVLLAAFSLVPLAAHWGLRGEASFYPYAPLWERLGDIWHGRLLMRPGMAAFVLLGWLFGLTHIRRRRPLFFALIALPPAFLLLGEALKSIESIEILSIQLPSRGVGYVGIVAVMPLAALITLLGREISDRLRVLPVVMAAALVLLPMGSYRDSVRSVRPTDAMFEAARRLRALVPDGARFAMQQYEDPKVDAQLVGVTHADYWMVWASGRNALNMFLSSPALVTHVEPMNMLARSAEDAADTLARFGVTHVVLTYSPDAHPMMTSSRFSVVWRSGPMAILAVHAGPGQPPPASLLSTEAPTGARLTRADPEHLRFDVDPERPTAATVAVAWSPKWHARLDGKGVPLGRTSEGLLSVRLPEGASMLSLDFRNDVWGRLGLLVSLLTVAGVVAWGLRRRLGRKRVARIAVATAMVVGGLVTAVAFPFAATATFELV